MSREATIAKLESYLGNVTINKLLNNKFCYHNFITIFSAVNETIFLSF